MEAQTGKAQNNSLKHLLLAFPANIGLTNTLAYLP